MIVFFPSPYKDELFYSVCARYANYVQYAGRDSVQVDLFGRRKITSAIDFPNHLGSFIESLPHGNKLTADRIIDEHTLLPFHSPFLTAARVRCIRNKMIHPKKGSARKASGIIRYKARKLDSLRFCQDCVVEDRQLFGECLWHRSHQIPGIDACHKHSVILEHSGVRLHNVPSSVQFISAERAILSGTRRMLDLSDSQQQNLLNLAKDCFWLLEQRALVPELKVLRGVYVKLLNALGIATAIGVVRISILQDALRSYYSPAFLSDIGCDFDERQSTNWPSRFIKDLSCGKTHHPLQHLLMIRLLGHSAESFFGNCTKHESKTSLDNRPFGKGPWPCLNPVCKDFRKLTISVCRITSSSYRDHRPVGSFACTCGFIYLRNGPDSSLESRFKFDCVKDYGATWNCKLKSLWEDSSISLSRMARVLDVKSTTLKFRAALLRLKFPRVSPKGKIVRKTPDVEEWLKRNQPTRAKTIDPQKKEKYRKLWLSVVDKYPRATRKQICRLSSGSYHWLYKHDRAWLKRNSPPHCKRGGPRLDWLSLDNQLSTQVQLIADSIKFMTGRPVRITKSAIARGLRNGQHLLKLSEKFLPLTARVIGQVLESIIDFYRRRIAWAADCFRQEFALPSVTSLAKRASIKWGKWYLPEVEAAITAARDALRDYFEAQQNADDHNAVA